MDWQSPIAIGIVAITLAVFIIRLSRRKPGKNGCGGSCNCRKTKP